MGLTNSGGGSPRSRHNKAGVSGGVRNVCDACGQSMLSRAAQGDRKASAKSRVGTQRDGGVSEKVVEIAKVERHRAGKAPKWAEEGSSANTDDHITSFGMLAAASSAPPGDRRLQRLQQREDDSDDDDDSRRRRRRSTAEVLEDDGSAAVLERGGGAAVLERGGRGASAPAEAEEEEDEDDDAIEARRERMRAAQRRRRQEEEAAAAAEEEDDDGDEGAGAAEEQGEESSEYETDSDAESDEDDAGRKPMLKPVFISAEARETVKERELLEAQEEAARERRERKAEDRKEESRALLVEAVRKEEEGNLDKAIEFAEMPDDDDEVNELEEFDMWKLRELKRVRRERAERAAEEAEKRELARRRALTDEQRAKEDEEFRKQRADYEQPKEKWKFLQKYYHRGAYFQEEDETGNNKLGPVMMQDFGKATGKDAVGDKAAMPAPMQVKNFGFRSQVKWTHLSAEDTMGAKDKDGKRDLPLWAADKSLAQKFERKQAGNKGADDFSRPSAKRKKS